MEKYLITGFSGFVSAHFLKLLETKGARANVLGVDIVEPEPRRVQGTVEWDFQKIDLLNRSELENILDRFQPDYILHLASYSSVAFSWKNPVVSFHNNTSIFLNLVDAIRELKLKTRVLSVGSSEEYGNTVSPGTRLSEDHTLKPVSPYAVARISQELMSRIYVDGYGLNVIMTRSFNHIGPGQRESFVVSSFAKQLVDQKKAGKSEGMIVTGDTSVVRDFVDVRDVAQAYHGLLHDGRRGEIYNVCSGHGISLDEVIAKMAGILSMRVERRVDPDLIRPNDNKVIVGDNRKIAEHIAWHPRITLDQTLRDLLAYWESQE